LTVSPDAESEIASSTESPNKSEDDSHEAQSYDQVVNRPHEAKWSHELLGGAAAFEAAKAYEDHVSRNGMMASILPQFDSKGLCLT
jgi:hypothetical protein